MNFKKWSPLMVLTYELQGLIDELIKMIVKETYSHKHRSAKGSKSESTELSLASRKASVILVALHPDMIIFLPSGLLKNSYDFFIVFAWIGFIVDNFVSTTISSTGLPGDFLISSAIVD